MGSGPSMFIILTYDRSAQGACLVGYNPGGLPPLHLPRPFLLILPVQHRVLPGSSLSQPHCAAAGEDCQCQVVDQSHGLPVPLDYWRQVGVLEEGDDGCPFVLAVRAATSRIAAIEASG